MREPEPRSTQKLSKVYVGTNGSEKIKFHMLHFLAKSLLELIFPRTRLWPNVPEIFLPTFPLTNTHSPFLAIILLW